jgi:cytochrome b-561
MLIGFIILGSEGNAENSSTFLAHDFLFCNTLFILAAIMVYKVLPTWNHDTTKLIHLILHAIALVLGVVGIYCAFKFHNESGIANLYSLHSWLGIGTISLYGVQVRPCDFIYHCSSIPHSVWVRYITNF